MRLVSIYGKDTLRTILCVRNGTSSAFGFSLTSSSTCNFTQFGRKRSLSRAVGKRYLKILYNDDCKKHNYVDGVLKLCEKLFYLLSHDIKFISSIDQ